PSASRRHASDLAPTHAHAKPWAWHARRAESPADARTLQSLPSSRIRLLPQLSRYGDLPPPDRMIGACSLHVFRRYSAPMDALDAAAMADRTARLSLLRSDQIEEAWHEIDKKDDASAFLRAMERKGFLTPFQTQKLQKGETEGFLLGG